MNNGLEVVVFDSKSLKLNDLNYTKENEDKIFDEIKNIKNEYLLTIGYTKNGMSLLPIEIIEGFTIFENNTI